MLVLVLVTWVIALVLAVKVLKPVIALKVLATSLPIVPKLIKKV